MSEKLPKSLTDSDSRPELDAIGDNRSAAYETIEKLMEPGMINSAQLASLFIALVDLGDKIKVPHPDAQHKEVKTSFGNLMQLCGIGAIETKYPETDFSNFSVTAEVKSILKDTKQKFWAAIQGRLERILKSDSLEENEKKHKLRKELEQLISESREDIFDTLRTCIATFDIKKSEDTNTSA